MRFDLTDLRLFMNIHDTGTITKGAQRSHITLASASERVKGMEESLGVALLIRDRRGVPPTSAGRALLHHARAVLPQMDRLHAKLDHNGKEMKVHVRLLSYERASSQERECQYM